MLHASSHVHGILAFLRQVSPTFYTLFFSSAVLLLCCPPPPLLQDDLYINQMQQGAGNPLLHLMGDFASQVFASSLQSNPLPLEEVQQYIVRVGQPEAAAASQTASTGEGEVKAEGDSTNEQLGCGGGGVGVSSGAECEPPVAVQVAAPCLAPSTPCPAEQQSTGSGGATSLPDREWPAGMPRVRPSQLWCGSTYQLVLLFHQHFFRSGFLSWSKMLMHCTIHLRRCHIAMPTSPAIHPRKERLAVCVCVCMHVCCVLQ